MNTLTRTLAIALLAAAPIAANAQFQATRCSVTDMPAFDAFIASKPTVEEFRAAYSCVMLLPGGGRTTFESRYDNSRYFGELDASGRIVGGYFF